MSLPRRFAPFAFAVLLAGTVGAMTRPPDPGGPHQSPVETARIHAHFDSVLAELHARDVSTLSPSQRAQRAALVAALRAYDARGDFPHNYDFPGVPTPYFVDRRTGTLCAVAHLLESTGRRDIVDRVARADNNVWVAELAGDTAFAAWLDTHGISLEEAARVQVPYVDDGGMGAMTGKQAAVIGGGSVLALGSAIGTSIWNAKGNADGHSRSGNVLGLTSSVLTTLIGASFTGSSSSNGQRNVGMATASVGGLGVLLATRSMMRRGRTLALKREAARSAPVAPEAESRGERTASLSPMIPVGRNAGAGMTVQIRF